MFFKVIGLNIFQNKFSAFENVGVINYLRRALVPGELILLLIKRELYKKKSKVDKYIFMLIFILFIFNGGKASIVSFIMYIYAIYYNFFRTKTSKKFFILKKYEKITLILAIISLLFLTKIIYKEINYYKVLKRILFRIISYGDTYYMLYPSKLYDKLDIPNLSEYYLYRLVLPILRKIGYEGNALGFLIVEKLYNIDKAWTGPNTRSDIILQLNLGYLGSIGAIISAKIMSILRRISSKNYLILYIIINLFVINETIMMDFSIFAMSLIGILLIICPGIILVEFLYDQ
ncbi:hypothetical protein OQE61_05800 [Cetobacterium somerae]|uniref:hypothetical protein n=1 Tax=Cetobacterium somerae TaxID=188913 RepID=UPI00224E5ACF|nr:hypothetical protein [Cetobacterium somerae]MCX3067001.1 hypothetical protein [Cetobacterium somerae]